MQAPAQRVTGAVQNTGPQPVNPAAVASALSSSATLGAVSDAAASNVTGSSVNAKLGRLMMQNDTIIELLARMVELLEVRDAE